MPRAASTRTAASGRAGRAWYRRPASAPRRAGVPLAARFGRCSPRCPIAGATVGTHRGTPRQPLSPSWAERALIGTEVAVVATNTAANTTARVELFAKSSRNRVILSGKVVVTKCPGQAYADFWLRHPSYATPR